MEPIFISVWIYTTVAMINTAAKGRATDLKEMSKKMQNNLKFLKYTGDLNDPK